MHIIWRRLSKYVRGDSNLINENYVGTVRGFQFWPTRSPSWRSQIDPDFFLRKDLLKCFRLRYSDLKTLHWAKNRAPYNLLPPPHVQWFTTIYEDGYFNTRQSVVEPVWHIYELNESNRHSHWLLWWFPVLLPSETIIRGLGTIVEASGSFDLTDLVRIYAIQILLHFVWY